MSKLNELTIKGQIKAMQLKDKAIDKLAKASGDSQLVVALVLIAVAVGLCILFRETIKNIMTDLFSTISDAIGKLSAGTVNPVG